MHSRKVTNFLAFAWKGILPQISESQRSFAVRKRCCWKEGGECPIKHLWCLPESEGRRKSERHHKPSPVGVSPPSTAADGFEPLGILLRDLGLEDNVPKACPPASLQVVLGIVIDCPSMTTIPYGQDICFTEGLDGEN